jgi:hypothetical protein
VVCAWTAEPANSAKSDAPAESRTRLCNELVISLSLRDAYWYDAY